MLLTETGCNPDPVLLGLGFGGALVDDFSGGRELTGKEPPVVAVVESAVEAVVAGKEVLDEAMGPLIELGGETAPPAQLAALVAGPGPAWMGLQPGS